MPTSPFHCDFLLIQFISSMISHFVPISLFMCYVYGICVLSSMYSFVYGVWKDRKGAQCELGKRGVRREIPFVF